MPRRHQRGVSPRGGAQEVLLLFAIKLEKRECDQGRMGTTTHKCIITLLLICVLIVPSLGLVDPYKTLGVQKGASKEEIKRAFKTLVLKWYVVI